MDQYDHVQQRKFLYETKLLALLFVEIARTELLLESLDSASRIDELLLARVERMAVRAYFSVDFLYSRARLKRVAAPAADDYLLVFWMNAFFHFISPNLDKTVILQIPQRFAIIFLRRGGFIVLFYTPNKRVGLSVIDS